MSKNTKVNRTLEKNLKDHQKGPEKKATSLATQNEESQNPIQHLLFLPDQDPNQSMDSLTQFILSKRKILILVGAGISVSCGIPDFRSPNTGLYSILNQMQMDQTTPKNSSSSTKTTASLSSAFITPEDVFDLETFQENPHFFYQFCESQQLFFFSHPSSSSSSSCQQQPEEQDENTRNQKMTNRMKKTSPSIHPSPTHYFLKLLMDIGIVVRIYTQNIDDLERLVGIPEDKLIHVHGSIYTATCFKCHSRFQHGIPSENGKKKMDQESMVHTKEDNENHPQEQDKHSTRKQFTTPDNVYIHKKHKNNNTRNHMDSIFDYMKFEIEHGRIPLCPRPSKKTKKKTLTSPTKYHRGENDDQNYEMEGQCQSYQKSIRKYSTRPSRNRPTSTTQTTTTALNQYSMVHSSQSCCGLLKPGITFFGEEINPKVSRMLEKDTKQADLLLVIGTSLSVAPITNIFEFLPPSIPRILMNKTMVKPPSQGPRKDRIPFFDAYLLGNCDDIAMKFVQNMRKIVKLQENMVQQTSVSRSTLIGTKRKSKSKRAHELLSSSLDCFESCISANFPMNKSPSHCVVCDPVLHPFLSKDDKEYKNHTIIFPDAAGFEGK